MKRFLLVIIGLILMTGLAACQGRAAGTHLTVFAAASLTEAFGDLGQQFERLHPGVTVTFNFAGSQQLAQQLAQGAPADVFASANQAQMDAALRAGRVTQAGWQIFARNRLVVIVPADNPGDVTRLQDLSRPGLKLLLAAQEVPAGQYALAFLENASQDAAFGSDFKDQVLQNVVSYEENVRAVLSKIALGEADAGIVYASDVAQATAFVRSLEIPAAWNVIAEYPLAVLQDSPRPELAAAFVEYILSPEGQAKLAEYGFEK